MKKLIQIDRKEIALARTIHACRISVVKRTGEIVALEDALLKVAPKSFRDRRKLGLCRQFVTGGEFASTDYGSTNQELRRAAGEIFRALMPGAMKGFMRTGQPCVWAHLAREAAHLAKCWHE